jgi:hypothetical protein
MERRGLEPRHWREVDAGDPRERGAEGKGRCVAWRLPMRGRRWGQGLGGRIDAGRNRAADALDVLIAVGDGRRGNVIERQRWGERAKMLRPVIPLARFGHGLWTGCDAVVPLRRSGLGGALARDERAEHTQARHACHRTHHGMPVKRHLIQGLVHVLHRLDSHLEQRVAMAEETPERTQGLGRTQ